MIQACQAGPLSGRPLPGVSTAKALGLATLITTVIVALRPTRALASPAAEQSGDSTHTRRSTETRTLHGSAALLASSVLADSMTQHYRGSFKNPGMYTPLITSGLTIFAGISGAASTSGLRSQNARTRIYAAAAAVGAIGTAFHIYNILRRPGGLSWLNLFYAAPPAAPAALSYAGLLGLAATRIELTPQARPLKLLGLPAGRTLAAMTGLGLAGTCAEAGLLHFRGAFHNPFMLAPITAPPVASALMLKTALSSQPNESGALTRSWLRLTALIGVAGIGFHAFGVSRAMGGWRNWSQNLFSGPPLPAPPSFAALAGAGLAALSLMERENV